MIDNFGWVRPNVIVVAEEPGSWTNSGIYYGEYTGNDLYCIAAYGRS